MYRSGLRSLGTLLPVLGVTWLFGILAVNKNADFFQYLFIIANSLQVSVFCYLYMIKNIKFDKYFKETIKYAFYFNFHIETFKNNNLYAFLSKVYFYIPGLFYFCVTRCVKQKGKNKIDMHVYFIHLVYTTLC